MNLPFAMPRGVQLGVGLVIHMITSGFWGHQVGRLVRMMPKLIGSPYAAIPVGLSWGLVVWLLMGVIIGPALDPALREAHPTHYLVAHLLYGLCSVVVLRAWMGRQRCRPHAAKRSLVEERARARARSDTIV